MKYFIFLTLFAGLVSCKNDSKAASENPVQEKNIPALAEWGFLTHDLFHYTYINRVSGKVPKEEYMGKWIDLKRDYSYEWGFYDEILGAGKWTYDNQNEILSLNPNTGKHKRSEWRVKNGESQVFLAGTPRFEDNPFQMRWTRATEKPKKK